MTRVVVIGNGMAGSRFVQELLARSDGGQFDITVVGDEPGDTYNRMLLSNVLAGVTRPEAIAMIGRRWYDEHGVLLRSGIAATDIDRARQLVALDDGSRVPYDILVLATGSDANLPRLTGLVRDSGDLLPGAVVFRTLADCEEIADRADRAAAALVLGAGVLGLEAARGLAGRGIPTTLLQRGGRLMERQLDTTASHLLTRLAETQGLLVRPHAEAAGVIGTDRVAGITLADGETLPADLLVLACGVTPRIALARRAGLAVGRGVTVDDAMRSVSDQRIFAVGECAEHRGDIYGLVAPVWEMAATAAAALAGVPACYSGTPQVTRLKAEGLELVSMGRPAAEDGDGSEAVTVTDAGRGIYQKLVIRDGRLTGAILLGDTRAVGTVSAYLDQGLPVPSDRISLLLSRTGTPGGAPSPTGMPGGATVCQCNAVKKDAIMCAFAAGATTLPSMVASTRVTTGCGTCRYTVEGLIDWLAAGGEPVAGSPAGSLA